MNIMGMTSNEIQKQMQFIKDYDIGLYNEVVKEISRRPNDQLIKYIAWSIGYEPDRRG